MNGMPSSRQEKHASEPNKKLEYTTCVDFCKYSGGVQIAQISVFIALMSGFAYFLFGDKKPDESLLKILKCGAGFLAICLWAVQESHAYLASKFFRRAQDLEKELGFHAFSQLPIRTPFWWGPTSWAFRVIYLGFTVFWLGVSIYYL